MPERGELEAAHCWEPADAVPGWPEVTDWRRRARLHHARWRHAAGHPIGTQPLNPKPGGGARLVGSRLPTAYAKGTGATFVGPAAHAAARSRLAHPEPDQSLDVQRLWADLLWAPTLAVNLFGPLGADLDRADALVHDWWPDVPGRVVEVRLLHSPGWLDPAYIESLVSLDAVIELALDDGTRGVLGVTVRHHEPLTRETPKPSRVDRYLEVGMRSGAIRPDADLPVAHKDPVTTTWLAHLLVLSMLQHATDGVTWGRHVVVHPRERGDVAATCAEYASRLTDAGAATFATTPLEDLLHTPALVERYRVDPPEAA